MASEVDDALARLTQSGLVAPSSADSSLQRLSKAGLISSQQQQAYDPSLGGSTLQIGPLDTGIPLPQGPTRFLAGAGKSFYDTARGLRSWAADLVSAVPGIPQSVSDSAAAYRRQADENKKLDAPLMATGSGASGNLTGQVLQALSIPVVGEAGLARILGSAVAGAVQSGAQPVGTQDSRIANMGVGAALGGATQAGANVLGAIVRPAVSSDPARMAAAKFAADNGLDLTLGQRTGNSFVQRLEQMAANLPGSRGFYQKNAEGQQKLVSNVISDLTGGDAGKNIQAFGQGKNVTLSEPFFSDMRGIGQNFANVADRDAPNGALKTIEQYVGSPAVENPALAGFAPSAKAQAIAQGVPEFVPTSNSAAPKFQVGQQMPMVGPYGDFNNYWALRSLYGKRAFRAGDPTDRAAYGQIQDALDSAAMRSLEQQGIDPSALAKLRTGYAVEKTLRPAITVNPDETTAYNVAKVGSLISKKDASQPSFLDSLEGNAGDTLRELANFSRVVQPAKSSGTAENAIAGKIVTLELLKDLFSGAGIHGLLGTFGTLAGGPWVANTILQSTRNGVPLLRSASPATQELLNRLAAGSGLGLLGVARAGGIPALTGD